MLSIVNHKNSRKTTDEIDSDRASKQNRETTKHPCQIRRFKIHQTKEIHSKMRIKLFKIIRKTQMRILNLNLMNGFRRPQTYTNIIVRALPKKIVLTKKAITFSIQQIVS